MKKLNYYFTIYKVFFKNSFIREMDYRASFIGDFIDSFVNLSITILLFDIIYQNTTTIANWSKYETLLLVGYAQFITSLVFILFMNNLSRIQTYILKGDLDTILIKPCDVQFYVSFRYFYLGGCAGLFPAIFLILYSINMLNISISIMGILFFFMVTVCSVVIAYSLWFILMTCSFYFVKVTQLHELFLSVLKFSEYPASIYKGVVSFTLTFILPVIAISNIPIEFVLGKANKLYLLVILSIVFFLLSRLFWKISLHKYTSASS